MTLLLIELLTGTGSIVHTYITVTYMYYKPVISHTPLTAVSSPSAPSSGATTTVPLLRELLVATSKNNFL